MNTKKVSRLKTSTSVKQTKVARFLDAMAEESLSLSDDEIEAEMRDSGEDPKAIVKAMRASVDALLIDAGKAQMAAAKKEFLSRAVREGSRLATLPVTMVKKLVETALAQASAPGQLSLAFREGKFQSDDDLRSLARDLADLGLIDDDVGNDT